MKDQGLTRKLGIHMKRSLREAARGAAGATADRLTERVPGALQEELAARAQTERKGDGLDGARTAPSFRTALARAREIVNYFVRFNSPSVRGEEMDPRDRIIEEYSRDMARIRKALTAAGVPEAEDGYLLPEDERVRRLATRATPQGEAAPPAPRADSEQETPRRAPCQHCGKATPFLCADCAIDKRPQTHVCADCQGQHTCRPGIWY